MNEAQFCIGAGLWPGLSKMIEECGEVGDVLPELLLAKAIGRVQQVAGKIIGNEGEPEHWDGSNLPERLTDELGDLLAAIEFVIERNGLGRVAIDVRKTKKLALFRQWHAERLSAVRPSQCHATHQLSLTVLCALDPVNFDANFLKDVEMAIEANRAAIAAAESR